MRRTFAVIDKITEWSGIGISYFIYIIVIMLIYEVTMRYFFNLPTNWAHETSKLMFGAISVLMGAYCLLHNQHIRIDIVYGRFSPRKRAAIDLFTMLLIFFFASLLVIHGMPFAIKSFVLKETPIMAFKPPYWPVKACIPLAGLMVLVQGLAQWIRALHLAITGKELA